MFVKSVAKNYQKCLKCQKYTLHKCQQKEVFTGTCHAGVKEIVYAVKHNNNAVGFISVSGYVSDKEKHIITTPKTDLYHSHLNKQIPPQKLCDILIPPLIIMLENLCSCWDSQKQVELQTTDEHHYSNVHLLTYISQHYMHLTLPDLAAAFHKSTSAISHAFKRDNGMTLKSYCNLLKINDAKAMLQTSDIPITDIAYAVGFESLSYYINVFKKQTGNSPKEYRKLYK